MAFDALRAKLEASQAAMREQLNAAIYADGAPSMVRMLSKREPTWWDYRRWHLFRAQLYFLTLWKAIKGDDPYDTDADW